MLNKYEGLASYSEIKNILGQTLSNDNDQLHDATNDLINNFYIYPLQVEVATRWYHRLNLLWVMPLALVFSCFKWIITGRIGIEPPSRLGKLIVKLIGGY